METRRLSYFVRIAADGSLTKAAGVLRIAQPALSRQIRLLEQELGVALFSRTARGMQLTEAGEQLRAAVSGPLRELELALQNVRSFTSRIAGNVVIGMPAALGEQLAGPLTKRMDAEHPEMQLCMIEGYTGSLIDWLNRGMVDFALLEEHSRDDRLLDVPLRTEPLVLAGAADAPLFARSMRKQGSIEFRQAAKLPLILPSHHLGIRGAINDAAVAAAVTLNISLQADSMPLIRQLVQSGRGYTMLPLSYFREAAKQGAMKYRLISEPSLKLTTYLSSRRNSQSNRPARNNLQQMVLEMVKALLQSD